MGHQVRRVGMGGNPIWCVVLLLVLLGCTNSDGNGDDLTPGTTGSAGPPAEIRSTEPEEAQAGALVELPVLERESRSLSWTLGAWSAGERSEPLFQLIGRPPSFDNDPTWHEWDDRVGVELAAILEEGPDTVRVPDGLPAGHYWVCESFADTLCFELQVIADGR